ncbi:MAG: hypothetical protein K8F52_01840 [Candidatus Scalindua rubra]|uniref:Uncharacterized protein n=1 Tax=Candidatus Scalindua brodae TaxID=237368 RepID=A0A0B0EE51_9BACT|nr:MAG: hypothetical protein SCABRO_02847 [Candidatus Scalindua brodae]MBZ0107384.1 hypothetical protein [Candidatus Scalindua rubra]TWU32766.1 hypothetical protein S225a_17170 [Candidatus Brocadiaceae bacterium S225]
MDTIFESIKPYITPAIIVTIAGLVFTWIVARKQGVFKNSDLHIRLYGMEEDKKIASELIIGGPHSDLDILTPVVIQISNQGSASAHNVEVTLESDSNVVVNYPELYISPILTKSIEAIEGETFYLGNGLFRRVFRISELNPEKPLQLNNAGLPRNGLSSEKPIIHNILKVSVFERGKTAKIKKFGIWSLDTSKMSFHKAVISLSNELKAEYLQKSLFKRLNRWLRHNSYDRKLRLIEITDVRPVNFPNEEHSYVTVSKTKSSEGHRSFTGNLFTGWTGLI